MNQRYIVIFLSLLPGILAWSPLEAQPPAARSSPPPAFSVGDPAPPLQVATWVKGTPVSDLQKGKVYVIDVWSTWCIPCLAAMPHTTRLQNKFRDRGLVVLGVTATDKFGNSEEAIRKLLQRKGESVGFAIGIDAQSDSPKGYQGVFRGKTVEAYLGGALVPALPVAFVIDREGRVAFIGHPLEMEEAVEKCLDGTWDLGAARKQHDARGEAQELLVQLDKAVQAKEYDRGLALCRKLVKDVSHNESRVFAAVAGLMAGDDQTLARRAPDLALKAGQRAVALTKTGDPGHLSALAGVYFARGEVDKAIETQTRAVSLAEGGMKPILEELLKKYRAARP